METKEQTLQQASIALYLALNTLYQLHLEVELEGNDGQLSACAHCSQLADATVSYPCPSVQILLTDFVEMQEEIEEA